MVRKISAVVRTASPAASLPAADKDINLDTIHQIEVQEFNHSKVSPYEHVFGDQAGPGVRCSPRYRKAVTTIAAAVRHAAARYEMTPRKPLPAPLLYGNEFRPILQ